MKTFNTNDWLWVWMSCLSSGRVGGAASSAGPRPWCRGTCDSGVTGDPLSSESDRRTFKNKNIILNNKP